MSNVFVFRRPPHGVITEYFGGGKGGSTTTTNNVTQIPPEVLARYNAVNARAETVAQAPYQSYSQDPNAFVAPLSQTQQAGIQNTNAMAGAAQPYYGAATGLAAQSTGSVNPGGLNVGQYMNPYTQSVVNATQQALGQQQAQQLSQQQTEAIRGGAFGGERAGLQRAALLGQQGLAQAQAIAPLYQQNYNQALAAAQQQQGVGLGAEQANRQNLQNAATLFGSIGTNAQQAGLAGAQAQLAAGQTQQQTQQAGLQALYNQFQQQQGFPYQQAQFLANIAEGTGALSGNATSGTSTTTGGGGFFSDERLKENIQRVGETDDGQPIYRYNYKGDKNTQIGLLAQDVEKKHPEAVGLAGGYKTVNYKKATEDAVHKEDGGALSGTDAYSIGAPSAMLRENSGKGLGAMPSLPQAFQGGRDIPIETGANAAGLAAMRSPLVTGFAPGVREGKQAELDTLLSAPSHSGPNGEILGSGPGYVSSRINTLQNWLNQNNSQGGLVSGPGNFARGGLADGGYMNPALQYYAPNKGDLMAMGPYGVAPRQSQQRGLLQGTKFDRPAQQPQRNPIDEATKIGQLGSGASSAWGARPDFLRSAADVAVRERAAQATDMKNKMLLEQGKSQGLGAAEPAAAPAAVEGKRADIMPMRRPEEEVLVGEGYGDVPVESYGDFPEVYAARGGLIGDRHHYSRGGINPYGGLGGNDILGPIIEEQDTSRRLSNDKVTPPPAPKQQSDGLGQLAQMANTGKSLYKGGEYVAGKLGLGAPETAMSATSAEALPGVIDLTSGAGIAGAAPEALSAGLAGGEALAGGAAAAEGLAAGAGLAELGAGAAAAGAGIMEALPFLAFLSDERAKHDIKKVGELYDGQPVYRFKYNGDDKTQMGLIAQKVEKGHPEAVGLAGGMKTVDYKRATDAAAKRGHYQTAGGVPVNIPDRVPEGASSRFGTDVGQPMTEEDKANALIKTLAAQTIAEKAPLMERRPVAPVVPVAPVEAAAEPVAKPVPARPVIGETGAGRSPYKYLTSGLFSDDTKPDTKAALTSENLWVPALAGIGAMLASPNKTLGAAIGSGLVGGTTAYTGLQKQQSEMDLQQAQERGANVEAAKKSIIYNEKGLPTAILVSTPTGMRYMDFGEAYRSRENLNILPATRMEMEAAAKAHPELIEPVAEAPGTVKIESRKPLAPLVPAPSAAAPAAAPPANAPKTTQQAPVEPEKKPEEKPVALRPVEQIFGVDKPLEGRISSEIDKRIGTDTSGIKDEFAIKNDRAKESLEQRPLLMQLGAAFAGLPKESPMATGAAAPVASTLAGWGNSILKTVGLSPVVNEKDIARAEKIQKITAQINKEVTEGSGQKSYNAYNAMGKMFPSMGTSGEGFADNFASIVIANQMPEDENRFAQEWLKSASKINPTYAVTTGPAVSEAFKDKYGAIYENDRRSIASMFKDTVMQGGKPLLDPDTKRPVNWFQYVSEHGGKLKPEIKKAIEGRYGEGILRYFPEVTR